jgi:hypothetical protein
MTDQARADNPCPHST